MRVVKYWNRHLTSVVNFLSLIESLFLLKELRVPFFPHALNSRFTMTRGGLAGIVVQFQHREPTAVLCIFTESCETVLIRTNGLAVLFRSILFVCTSCMHVETEKFHVATGKGDNSRRVDHT